MNAVIGTEDDIIGFGLTGVEQRIVLNGDTTPEDVKKAVQSLDDSTDVCFIQENLLEIHTPNHESIMFITIPSQKASPEVNDVLSIARKTLGIKLE